MDNSDTKTKFLFLSPVLASTDVSRDVEWYEQKLGFINVYDSSNYQDGQIDYAVVGRQNLYLHLQFQYPKDVYPTDVRIEVQNIEPLIQEFLSKGTITDNKIIRKTGWNTCEFGILDPNRNRIFFYEEL